MFTPQEVSEKVFPKASFGGGGYNMASVDEFLDALTEDYTALFKENVTLKAKLKVLAEKVEEYRSTEEAMRQALLTAQKMAAKLVQEAQSEKEKILPHNSVEFNGIKLFSGTGFKLSDEIENEIEALILDTPEKIELKDGCDIGHVYYEKDAAWDYIRYVMKTVQTDFNGIRVALDCANGSASVCAQRIFEGLGAKCIMLNDKPDGTNINKDCGSTHIEGLQKAVVDNHCDIGLAFDGDADRCLAVDEKGELIDGDKILAIFSKYMKNMGILKNNTCVVTVMTNLGFFKYAKANGIVAATTKVGDRYVLEEMLKGGYNIGGEQSGHIILLDYANTGDGELTGTKLLTVLKCTGEKASELASCMECYPQVLVNVKITADKKGMWDKVPEITDAIKMYSEKLGDEGRILVRESGTEPLVRVMIEGKRTGIITEYAHKIAELIEKM